MTGPSRTFRMTGHLMGVLRRILDFHAHVEGLENLVDRPTLFVVNHFTRMETFVVPYLLFQHTGREAHSLADSGLFKGLMGEYLRHMGTVSVREPLRNRRIIGELLVGRHDWVIFPEGLMVKTKDVVQDGTYTITSPYRSGPPHTGAAVLALKTELTRQRYLGLQKQQDSDSLRQLRDRYGLENGVEPSPLSTVIVPVNITFYPIRPHANALSRVATRIKRDLPERVIEELRTEGSLLLDDTDMSIYLGKPIEVADYLKSFTTSFSKWIPTLTDTTQENFVVWTQKGPLTRAFMDRIYTSTAINIDHLVCLGLVNLHTDRIPVQDFHRAIMLSALTIRETRSRRTHPSLQSRLVNIVADEPYEPMEDIIALAKSEGILSQEGDDYVINRARLDDPHHFHDIRLHNVARVIANEAMPMHEVVKTVARYVNRPSERLRKELARSLRHEDVKEFDRDYEAYYEEGLSKAPSVGRPFILRNADKRVGILLCHGYLAAPAEVRPLGEFLYEAGYSVYGARLKGFGTGPKQMMSVTWQDWQQSFDRAYAILKNECDEIILGGFSAGALLVLQAAARKKDFIRGLFCINTPLVLADRRIPFAPAALAMNKVMKKFHGPEVVAEYVENHSETPEINYSVNYLKGIRELTLLIDECRKSLSQIEAPCLIVHGDADPVSKPEGADIIESAIASKVKKKILVRADNHNIVRHGPRDEVFTHVLSFIQNEILTGSGR